MDRSSKYYQIAKTERFQIYALQKAGLKVDAIALQLGRHRSSIYQSRLGFEVLNSKRFFAALKMTLYFIVILNER